MSAPLVFIVPVRHHDSVPDWPLAKHHLAQTLASIAAQTVSHWECVIVANDGSDLPELPPRCNVIRVKRPAPILPDRVTQREAYYDAIRTDKGLRIFAGLSDVREDSHVMVVDFDDFVSRRLAELVFANRSAPGWNVEKGYVWSGGDWCYLQPGFHGRCGTSHIIRRDLFGILETHGTPDMTAIKRRLGSHIFIHSDLATEGRPLAALPFPGAVYRIGNSQSTSGIGALFGAMTPAERFLTNPLSTARRLSRYRYLDSALRAEFSIPLI